MRLDRAGTLAAWCVAVLLHAVTAAAATCTSIFTPADLDKIRKNLYGSFCLEQDIDLASVSNFRPIGMNSFGVDPFGGKFDGKGHVIRNLTIRSGGVAGFFAAVGGAGTLATVTNIGLVHVNVVSTQGKDTGGLVATMYNSALISDSYVTGSIVGWNFGFLGGLVGTQAGGTIQRSHSSASVTGSGGAYAGGLVGDQGSSGGAKIVQSYATGPVSVSGSGAHVGGLVGDSIGRVIQSSASGPVEVSDGYQNLVGGLVGVTIRDSTCNPVVEQSFATGSVTYNAPGDITLTSVGSPA